MTSDWVSLVNSIDRYPVSILPFDPTKVLGPVWTVSAIELTEKTIRPIKIKNKILEFILFDTKGSILILTHSSLKVNKDYFIFYKARLCSL